MHEVGPRGRVAAHRHPFEARQTDEVDLLGVASRAGSTMRYQRSYCQRSTPISVSGTRGDGCRPEPFWRVGHQVAEAVGRGLRSTGHVSSESNSAKLVGDRPAVQRFDGLGCVDGEVVGLQLEELVARTVGVKLLDDPRTRLARFMNSASGIPGGEGKAQLSVSEKAQSSPSPRRGTRPGRASGGPPRWSAWQQP